MVVKIANSIKNVSEQMPGMEVEPSEQFGDPKKTIKGRSITCLECGKSFQVITKKHLASHGLTPEKYRARYGYKKNASLIAKGLAKARRKKMQEMHF
jgi:predicted transcriptional regulator